MYAPRGEGVLPIMAYKGEAPPARGKVKAKVKSLFRHGISFRTIQYLI